MARLIQQPTIVDAAGTLPKRIEEFVGLVNTSTNTVSIARMTSPQGWFEPAQTPEFNEYSLVLEGTLHVELRDDAFDVHSGQAVEVTAGEWVRYSTPGPGGAVYVSVCIPAFSPDTVNRDNS